MSTTVTVSNSLQLAAALKAATTTITPETILLQAGTYSALDFYKFNPRANVTIESASVSAQAVIQSIQVYDSSNVTFNDLNFTTSPRKPTGQIATSYFDTNVNFTNDNFTGRVSNSYASEPWQGLVVGDSTNTTVSGSSFQYVQNGVTEKRDNGITVSNNIFTNMFGDGIDNAASLNVKLLNNRFTNLHIDRADNEHSDCIQFWTSGETTAGGNITIYGNRYNVGSGGPAQGIFITDPLGTLTYSNVTIENNDLVGTGWNGLTLEHVSNALVRWNTLQSVVSTGQTSRLSLEGRVSGLVEYNKVGGLYDINGNTATITGNTTLAAISLATAQSLVSSMASVTSSATAGATSRPLLTASSASGAGTAISAPTA